MLYVVIILNQHTWKSREINPEGGGSESEKLFAFWEYFPQTNTCK